MVKNAKKGTTEQNGSTADLPNSEGAGEEKVLMKEAGKEKGPSGLTFMVQVVSWGIQRGGGSGRKSLRGKGGWDDLGGAEEALIIGIGGNDRRETS